MDNNNIGQEKNKGLFKLMLPIILVILGVIGYLVYQSYSANSSNNLNPSTNTYLIGTRLGKDVDIINKENLSFTTNINDQTAKIDHSSFEIINPSGQVGRANPFLP